MTSSLPVFLGRNKRLDSKSGEKICKYEKGFWSETKTKVGIYERTGPEWSNRSRVDLARTVRRSMERNTFWKRQDTWEEQFENINRQIKEINETTQIEPSQSTPINLQEQEFVEIEDFRRALDDLEQKIKIQEIFLKKWNHNWVFSDVGDKLKLMTIYLGWWRDPDLGDIFG